ncbi:MAG TPA: DUF6766 family protein [Thermoanaerobaculia bacterium]|nr:DUF6766 family protein [Thermoanaerobaculia bacterium]
MSKLWRENGLSLVLVALFVFSFFGQVAAGHRAHNEEQRQHGEPTVGVGEYLRSGHFLEATAENWESEFLQMFAYVLLTAWLYQKGSSESRKLDAENKQDRDPREHRRRPRAPWPVRKGGEVVLWLYEHSLALVFLLLFLFSIAWHARGGLIHHNEEQLAHGQPPVGLADYVGGAQFWFESFQNWQSEFLSLVAMVVLSIWLRQRYSPESKPVDAPHGETGTG